MGGGGGWVSGRDARVDREGLVTGRSTTVYRGWVGDWTCHHRVYRGGLVTRRGTTESTEGLVTGRGTTESTERGW